MVGGDGAVWQHIKATPKPLELARFAQAGKIGAGDVVRL
jgi:6-phosphogluconate dehydrogenase (decarboxylating)